MILHLLHEWGVCEYTRTIAHFSYAVVFRSVLLRTSQMTDLRAHTPFASPAQTQVLTGRYRR